MVPNQINQNEPMLPPGFLSESQYNVLSSFWEFATGGATVVVQYASKDDIDTYSNVTSNLTLGDGRVLIMGNGQSRAYVKPGWRAVRIITPGQE